MASGFDIVGAPNRRLSEDEAEGHIPARGSVTRVSKEWRVHEDGALAQRLQREENEQHFGKNRQQRHTVRKDIIDAKIVQHEEELRQQEEKMREIEEKRQITNKDAAFVQRMLSEEEDEEDRLQRIADEDERLCRAMMRDVELDDEHYVNQQQLEDERVAIELQRKEQRRYERYREKKRERELERARKRLEREIANQREGVLPGAEDGDVATDQPDSFNRQEKRLSRSSDGRLEDAGDFSDFYRVEPGLNTEQARRQQELQDEELARLLQDQEHKRGGQPNKDALRSLESRDEQLAQILHQQEQLRAQKYEKRMRERRLIKSGSQQQTNSPTVSMDAPTTSSSTDAMPPTQYAHPPTNLYTNPPTNQPAPPSTSSSIPQYHSPPDYYQATRHQRTGQSPPQYRPRHNGIDQSQSDSRSRQNALNQSQPDNRPRPNTLSQSHSTHVPDRFDSDQSQELNTSRDSRRSHSPDIFPRDNYHDGKFTASMPKSTPNFTSTNSTTNTRTIPLQPRTQILNNTSLPEKNSGARAPRRKTLLKALDVHAGSDSDSENGGFNHNPPDESEPVIYESIPLARPTTMSKSRSEPIGASFNIVETLDPTYQRRSAASFHAASPGRDCHQYLRNQYSSALEYGMNNTNEEADDDDDDDYSEDDGPVVPVQGQRRIATGSKSSRRKQRRRRSSEEKLDKCKQQ